MSWGHKPKPVAQTHNPHSHLGPAQTRVHVRLIYSQHTDSQPKVALGPQTMSPALRGAAPVSQGDSGPTDMGTTQHPSAGMGLAWEAAGAQGACLPACMSVSLHFQGPSAAIGHGKGSSRSSGGA